MKKIPLRKMIYSFFALLLFAAVMLVLTHTVQNGLKTTEILPGINPDPVYVECEEGIPLEVSLLAKEDCSISGFQVLLVNISEESRGTLRFAVSNSSSQLLFNQVVPVETITPGKWITISGDLTFTEGQEYQLSILADESEPYFMQVPKGQGDGLPFLEDVIKDGEVLECGISLGVNRVEPEAVTYGDIFYYSIPLSILLLIAALIYIWAGRKNVLAAVNKLSPGTLIQKYGNDVFLILLFGCICVSIYSRAYLKGAYISADSAGYLREAVNLLSGNGFSYDGLAGYDTWFANWPIVYPALIAGMMAVTGTGAYLASKIVAMVIAGLILLVLRKCFGRDAWLYGLCLTNIGYLNLSYYTWSEIPFMLFLLCFGLILAKILKEDKPTLKWYIGLGVTGLFCFLTRYYGIFVWIVVGVYILALFIASRKKGVKDDISKAVRFTVTAFLSGCVSMGYLLMNKLMNGMASGVSRTMWWDDYQTLTNDLIESLLTEFFNIFSMQIPELIENFPFNLKVFIVVLILTGLVLLIFRTCKHFTTESVMITMAVLYYVIFIGIRYVSSMDSFYFRFFEPGTFLLCIGVIGLVLPYLRGKTGFHYFAGAVTVIMMIAVLSVFENGGMDGSNSYYKSLEQQWAKAYAEIPERSVVIFNDIDFRSSFYRPDVVDGTITPETEFEELKTTYYGSEYLCMKAEFAKVMLESGEYRESVADELTKGMMNKKEEDEFIVISLR